MGGGGGAVEHDRLLVLGPQDDLVVGQRGEMCEQSGEAMNGLALGSVLGGGFTLCLL